MRSVAPRRRGRAGAVPVKLRRSRREGRGGDRDAAAHHHPPRAAAAGPARGRCARPPRAARRRSAPWRPRRALARPPRPRCPSRAPPRAAPLPGPALHRAPGRQNADAKTPNAPYSRQQPGVVAPRTWARSRPKNRPRTVLRSRGSVGKGLWKCKVGAFKPGFARGAARPRG